MTAFDRRLTLARDGVAARTLEGVLPAERYLDPTARQCAVTAASIRKTPAPDAEQEDQLLFGEVFDVLLEDGGFSFGQARRDGYVGWVETAALHSPVEAATHRVHALRSYAFSRPDIKSTPIGLYSMNALITVEAREGRFVKAIGSGWFVESQLAPVALALSTDPASVAEQFLGAAYQWGGRESLGLDCSALVQQALHACGRGCPRDTDMQRDGLGAALQGNALRRGDLVFWKGHVAMMLDGERMIHANAHYMAVTIEPLAGAIDRIRAAGGGEPTAYRRP